MRRWLLVSGPAVLVIANIFVFAGVAWNRSGTPTSEIAFSQCEFGGLMYAYRNRDKVRTLRLWPQTGDLEPALLDEFQFPRESDNGARTFAKPAWVVIEHDGSSWQDYLELHRSKKYFSAPILRLVIVDAGRNADRLREKYPDRSKYIIVRGTVGRGSMRGPNSGNLIARIADDSLSVTSEFRTEMTEFNREARKRPDGSRAKDEEEPACQSTHKVIVKWGQRYEPWIADVIPVPAG